ncbi:hypothetical protein AAFN86_23535 [Roseomonas sp. CAU 1739]|uniref:hypothetical protein n=1 Tax=Roseomonas sp. CAU 1739 TaxID=3140364 RepID=UPI00325B064A
MTAFARFATRFSVLPAAPAKVAEPAKVERDAAELSQLSQVSQGRVCEREFPRIAAVPLHGADDNGPGAIAADALDHDEAERDAMSGHYAAEGAARPYLPSDPDPLRDGLLLGALQRPPAWSDPDLIPPPGAWCSCCGRFERRGGRWWTSAPTPDGWACVTCHPPDHLADDAVRVVVT